MRWARLCRGLWGLWLTSVCVSACLGVVLADFQMVVWVGCLHLSIYPSFHPTIHACPMTQASPVGLSSLPDFHSCPPSLPPSLPHSSCFSPAKAWLVVSAWEKGQIRPRAGPQSAGGPCEQYGLKCSEDAGKSTGEQRVEMCALVSGFCAFVCMCERERGRKTVTHGNS